ncbi:redoxin domain-containing protein [candidate division GN15 bacterium]|nr:redoxin domain-containing protein [candidate division GN15 bacterium]
MTVTVRNETRTLAVGDEAPDFTRKSHNEGDLNLAWYRTRKNVVLAFYPADWTPVCATQIPGYQQIIDEFDKHDCQLIGISVDSIPSHIAWAKSMGGLSFPLMSDYWPHGEIAQQYGVLTDRGFAERAVFLIDKQGIIRYIEVVDPAELPDTNELFRQIKALPPGPPRSDDYLRG